MGITGAPAGCRADRSRDARPLDEGSPAGPRAGGRISAGASAQAGGERRRRGGQAARDAPRSAVVRVQRDHDAQAAEGADAGAGAGATTGRNVRVAPGGTE